ncbi:MAG: hypothetical protein JSS76_09370 [Bacteroidetes bacterium]|nr:hypothetical protein [Bacteroidota bacterium]
MSLYHGIYIFPREATTKDHLLLALPKSPHFFSSIRFSRMVELTHFYCEDYDLDLSVGPDSARSLFMRIYLDKSDQQTVKFYDTGQFGHATHDFFEEQFENLADWLRCGRRADAYFQTRSLSQYEDYKGALIEPDYEQARAFIGYRAVVKTFS